MPRLLCTTAAATHFDTFLDLLPATDDPALRSPSADGRTLSHRELRRFVEEQELASFGIAQGDRVCAVLNNGPACALAFLALCRSCAWAPLNIALTSEELAFEFEDLPAKALIVQPEVSDVKVALRVAAEMNIPTIELHSSHAGLGCFTLQWLGSSPSLPPVPRAAPSRGDVCLVIHTSGTTAKPKIVPLNHENLAVGALCIKSTLDLPRTAHNLNIMPLFHIHGISINLLASLLSGASITPTPGLGDGSSFVRWILSGPQPVTWFSCVPTLHALILKIMCADVCSSQGCEHPPHEVADIVRLTVLPPSLVTPALPRVAVRAPPNSMATRYVSVAPRAPRCRCRWRGVSRRRSAASSLRRMR
jgi:oxalate---CoA ligase